jgi:hypothetical protein
VKAYLSLVLADTARQIDIRYDLKTTDFKLPPLTLEPLIENAVKYGTGKENGYICIDFNSNGSDPELSSCLSFVQWSEKAEGAVIGQYPSPTKDASDQPVFGTFNT